MQLKHIVRGSVAVVALVGSMALAQPAFGDEPEEGEYVEVEMTGIPVTAQNAVEHGFEVRTDQAGIDYAVHPDAPEGDFSSAVPIVEEPDPGQITPFNTLYGNCGYSWFYFTSKTSYKTGYQIYLNYGNTISWSWHSTFSSSIDLHHIYDGGGFATQRWERTRAHGAQALPGTLLSGQAGGDVLTTGGICTSAVPYDKIRW